MKDKNGHYSSFVLVVGESLLNYLLPLLFLSLSVTLFYSLLSQSTVFSLSLIASMSVRGLTQKEEEEERLRACRHPCLLTD